MSFTLDALYYTVIIFIILYFLVNFIARTPRNVCIVVLGDIGRSPRMQYHALSFANEGFRVYLVGYKGSKPQQALIDDDNIEMYHIMEPPVFIKVLPKLMGYVVKAFWQSTTLAFSLLLLPKMSSIFIQNPPSIPTMAVSYIISRLRFCEFVIDWHNYGHTILAYGLGDAHPVVKFSQRYEKFCGRLSSENICVTEAMKEDLHENWNVEATVVYDRPPSIFRASTVEEQHALFQRLSKEYPVFGCRNDEDESCTAFTAKGNDGVVTKLEHRPVLLVSSTSWTEDEDFGILLLALQAYDERKKKESNLPNLLCVITGKGPQKDYYKEKIATQEWSGVQFCLPWLEAEDYPTLLGSADVGVCLHTSSSGLDLPMKVVDMFGCGLPVCAMKFKCIGELVQHDKNGLVFSGSEELTAQLKDLLGGFPGQTDRLSTFRKNLSSFQSQRWHQCWKESVLPIFQDIGLRNSKKTPQQLDEQQKKKE